MPTLLFFLLLTSLELASIYGHGSCSTSCGHLQISYPFRLRGDPVECGQKKMELSCEDNNTVLDLQNSRYYVTNISNTYQFGSYGMLIDANVLYNNCYLPSSPFPMESFSGIGYGLHLVAYEWITFMNCSERILDDRYRLVPCLTGINNSSSFIYATHDLHTARIGDLKPKCKFLVKIPTNYYDLDAHGDVLRLLRRGFSVYWILNWLHSSPSLTKTIHKCIHEASQGAFYHEGFTGVLLILSTPLFYEINFLQCLYESRSSDTLYALILCFAIFSVLLLDAAIIMLVCRFLFTPLCLWVFLAYKISKLFKPIDLVETFLKNQEALSPQRYTYNEIIMMTSNFSEKIGEGGFGSVFKGKLAGGFLVAVKMMRKTTGDGEDFINEVSTIGRINHVNVVQLVGFCVEGYNTRALVYEYMANGSLDKYIFATDRSHRLLSIEKLQEIALSVARGLHYLHQGCNMRILHFDIKPHNILLDHKFTPKISDFGLAQLHPKGYSIVSISAARGTIGYIAPELVSRSFGTVSHKSDVYSFGMLLMDMAGGRRHVDMNIKNSSQVYYPSWIYDKLQKIEELQQREEIELYEDIGISNLERKLCIIGLWCIQTRPTDRPAMEKVVEMLETVDINLLRMPPKPFFSTSDSIQSNNFLISSSQFELSVISEN